MHTDDIIEAVGGMSRFQILMVVFIFGPKMLMAWGMLMMSFAGTTPDWWCVPATAASVDETDYMNNVTLKLCPTSDNITCQVVFSQDKNTVASEWDLICDQNILKSIITSVQMAGVFFGALFGGQSADVLGRKWTYFISLVLQSGFNLVAAFSVNWQMFTALRFLIGMTIGSLLVVSYPYFMEFIGRKWRPIASAMPVWVTGVCVFALSSWLRPDWSDQHIIAAALHLPFFAGWFFVPESLRWLAVKGRTDEAEKVVDQMSRYNKRQKPTNTLQLLKQVAEEEQKLRASGSRYTYLDIYRGWSICWKSLIIQFIWMCMSLVYYGISFGAGKLAGNLYLNIFLLAVVEVPATVMTFFMNNKFGRRWTAFIFFAAATVGSFGVCIVARTVAKDDQGIIINVLAMVAKLGVGAAWCVLQLLSSETYPTVTRNLGYGAANTAARIGGILAPYIFATGGDGDVVVPFVIVGSTMAACGVLSLILKETGGKPLADTLGGQVNSCGDVQMVVTAADVEKTKL
ncbi:organic cation transporter protein-like [Haliotis rufescens]|uniref:organic cation transporter protein-like n=1 Tax=Haliotis rufescens TaxID=6454 RepID=UPI00201F926A|nr:organic cation transporter protein-like [Haliotis rufescens]XP_046380848.2 organic cation transporter protein-like [Haliotis rufescens]XP_046380849.2 organic cation transporter protein-like [Haliotis rufescens]XP_046380850.2 organic cation transporter protein-like [Haliotis rufescens]XP_048240919.1 organic cation transporter protein-like [Haliotis rufescens]